jgi:hypothetical protein
MEEAPSNQHSAFSQNQNQQQRQNHFTAKDANGAEENKTLPLTNADDTNTRKWRMSGSLQQRAEALVRKIGEACDELERLAEENPELVGRVTHGAEEHKDAYLRLKARLELADEAPRCRWVKQDGTACRSPQMKKHIYCFAHQQMMEARALALSLPAQEDANAIQIGIMRIQKALIEDAISTKKAGLLLYSMQLALQNVGQTTFGQAKTEELVTETVSEVEAFSSQRSAYSEGQKHITETRRHGEEKSQNQNLFTAEDAEENKTLPLTNADDRGYVGERKGVTSDPWPEAVEFSLPPEMYRMDTPEGREAYEASLRRKIKTSGDR